MIGLISDFNSIVKIRQFRNLFFSVDKTNKILFIPSSLSGSSVPFYNLLKNELKAQGIHAKCDLLFHDIDLKKVMLDVNHYDVIYFMGGNTLELMGIIKEYQLGLLFAKYKGHVIGHSAGALVLCERAILIGEDQQSEDSYIYFDGIGLVDLVFDVHFDRQLYFTEISGKISDRLLLIPDDGYIVIDETKQYNHNVYTVKDNDFIKI